MTEMIAFGHNLREKWGNSFPDVAIIQGKTPNKHWLTLLVGDKKPIIVLGIEQKWENCCCMEQADVDKAWEYLKQGQKAHGPEVYLALYHRYYEIYGYDDVGISSFVLVW